MKNLFTKEHTLITKGVLIIMMLIHYLFTADLVESHQVITLLSNSRMYSYINGYCKMCIAGFAFLTAFGMTHSLMETYDYSGNDYFKLVCKRLIKLQSTVIFVCTLAIIYKRFVMVESIRELYDNGNGFSIIYIIIDMLGLATYFGTPTINVTWWYITYAVLLIVTMPFIFMAYKKFRYLLLIVGCLLSTIVLNGGACFSVLLPSVLLGTAFAYERGFDKICALDKGGFNKFVRICVEIFGIIVSYYLYCDVELIYSYIFAFLIPLIVLEFVAYIPIIKGILRFIGKHSKNIFLTHTFVYYYFYTEQIYSFKKDWLILLIMLIVCIGVSILLDLLKKISGYTKLIDNIVVGIIQKSM